MPGEDPNEMQREGSTSAEGGQTQDEGLMPAEQAIEQDLGGSAEPSDEQKETLERKVEEARQQQDS